MRAAMLPAILGLALVGGAARADTPQRNGFNETDLTRAVKAVDLSSDELAVEAERLRLSIAYDPAAAIGQREADERRALAAALRTGAGKADVRVRWFMAGAIVQPGGTHQTIFYNPLSHGWLTIDWHRSSAGKWQVTAAYATSSAFPGMWTQQQGSYLEALFNDYSQNSSQVGLLPSAQAEAEADRWLSGLAAWQSPDRIGLVDDVRRAITNAKSGTPIDVVPARVRASFVPVAGFNRSGGAASLLLGSPLMPGLFVAADFDARTASRHFTFVNLAVAGAAK